MSIRSIASLILKPQFISRIKIFAIDHSLIGKLFHLRYFALNQLDAKIEKYLNIDEGYFVELGANDGVNQSNTLYFEKFRGWKGVLIEPYPRNYNDLIRNRSDENYFANAACVGPSYTDATVHLAYSNLMTSTLGIQSDIQNPLSHANKGAEFWGGNTFLFEAPASTLNSILIKANSPALIDLLSLDTEGVELEVLKGVDHSKYRFRYICVESRKFEAIHQYLLSHNYSFVKSLSTHDYLFENMQILELK
jgi:FkbM family methyltransferase